MKILADSNIWIEFFNKPNSEVGNQLEYFLRNEDVCVTGILLAELLQGAVSQKEIDTIVDLRTQLPSLETTEETWIKAGILSQQLRRKGIILPLSDILLSTVAQENDCTIFTKDNHFKKIPHLKLL